MQTICKKYVDHDSHITKDEFIAYRNKTLAKATVGGASADPTGFFALEFDRIDKSKDGCLSCAELHPGLLATGWEQEAVERLFNLNIMDANKDRRITEDEFIAFKRSS